MTGLLESDSVRRIRKIRERFEALVEHLCEDVRKADEAVWKEGPGRCGPDGFPTGEACL